MLRQDIMVKISICASNQARFDARSFLKWGFKGEGGQVWAKTHARLDYAGHRFTTPGDPV